MVSEVKLIANRDNAKLGGVKTEEGKAAIRLNAVTHGLLSKEILLPGEDCNELNTLIESLVAEFQPQGALESILVDRLASSFWRLRRALRVEKNYIKREIINRAAEPPKEKADVANWSGIITGDPRDISAWQNYLRYETTIERQIYKAQHELERLQMARRGEKPPVPVVVDVDVSHES